MNEFAPRRSRLAALLFVSLAVNCVAIGLFAARWVTDSPLGAQRADPKLSPGPIYPGAGFGNRIETLADADREAFLRGMVPYQSEIQAARRDLTRARADLALAIARDPYDPAIAAAALAEIRRKTEALQAQVQNAAAHALSDVSPEGRRRLAQ